MTDTRPLRIVMPGGNGQVGTLLARYFHARGHDVCVIARHATGAPWRTTTWNGRDLGPWTNEFDGADVVINLAGRSVNCRYTQANRREIMESRTLTTALVGRAIAQVSQPPKLWLNASTATIYRHALDRPMDELTGEIGGNEPGAAKKWNFSIDVATSWERVYFAQPAPHTRKVAMRTTLVMNPDRGSIFDTLLSLVRHGLGGTVGDGRQMVSWIYDYDFARAIEFIIQHDELDGVVNIGSPYPIPQREFMRLLRQAWGTRVGLPATRWMLEVATFLMRNESELVLKSRWVLPTRLLQAGFTFGLPHWDDALKELVRRWRDDGRVAARSSA